MFGINAPLKYISNTTSHSTEETNNGGESVNGNSQSIALLVCVVGDQASKDVYEFFITQTFR